MNRLILIGLWCVCMVAAVVASLWMLLATLFGSQRAWSLAVAYDQLANTAFGGNEDETISSRAGKAAREGRRWGCVLCKWLDRIQPGHCENSIEEDEK